MFLMSCAQSVRLCCIERTMFPFQPSLHLILCPSTIQLVQSGGPLPFPLLPAESGLPLCGGGAGSLMDRGKNRPLREAPVQQVHLQTSLTVKLLAKAFILFYSPCVYYICSLRVKETKILDLRIKR